MNADVELTVGLAEYRSVAEIGPETLVPGAPVGA